MMRTAALSDPPRDARGCKVVLAGWYGAANLGDELILSVFIDWIREAGGTPAVISVNPGFTAATYGVETASYTDLAPVVETMAQADLLVLGGGGLFQDYDAFDRPSLAHFPARNVSQFAQFFYLARELGLPAAVLGQGVGPLRGADARSLATDVFDRADPCSVRDAQSARLLHELGLERVVPVAADPAWHVAPPVPASDITGRFPPLAGVKVMAMVVRDWPFDPAWERAFVTTLGHSLPAGWGCLWLDFTRTPSEDGKTPAGSEIAHRLVPQLEGRPHAVWQGMRVQEAASLIAGCDALVAMRLHGVLLGHVAGLPVAAIEYDDKVRALGDEIGVPADQRMSLGDIAARLPEALRRVCGLGAAPPFRLDAARRETLARSALAHRDLLWQAMAAAPRETLRHDGDPSLLAGWIARDEALAQRVVKALAHRLRARAPGRDG